MIIIINLPESGRRELEVGLGLRGVRGCREDIQYIYGICYNYVISKGFILDE